MILVDETLEEDIEEDARESIMMPSPEDATVEPVFIVIFVKAWKMS